MRRTRLKNWLFCAAALASQAIFAQNRSPADHVTELRLHLISAQAGKHRIVPAVVWLEPVAGTRTLRFSSDRHYTLLQKNRTFIPHLQVVPVGAVVQFPNADPFFHNVFSLFDGKRFDLGLYEAGSSKSVTFSREGVSYIFCDIHPEMSAVVLALSTPLYAVADADDSFVLHDVPAGDYNMHLWVEGVPQPFLDGLTRLVHLQEQKVDFGTLSVPTTPGGMAAHKDKFGNAYDPHSKSPYEP
jgi:plastocyanin